MWRRIIMLSFAALLFSSTFANADASYSVLLPIVTNPLTAQPHAVSVKSYTTYLRGRDRYVVGEVVNTTSQTVADVAVWLEVTYQDATVVRKGVNAYIRVLPPQQSTPFKFVISGAPEPLVALDLSLVSSCCDGGQYPPRYPVTIKDTRMVEGYGVTITGHYQNNHPFTLYDPVFVVTFYDGSGHVVGVEATERRPVALVDDYIAPRYTSFFAIETTLLQGEYAHYVVQAEAYAIP